MKKIYEVKNVKCEGCAATLKKALFEEFGDVFVDLQSQPRRIILDIEPKNEESLKLKLRKLGYPLVNDNLNKISTVTATAKSLVSCAIGKMDNLKSQ